MPHYKWRVNDEQAEELLEILLARLELEGIKQDKLVKKMRVSCNLFAILRDKRREYYPSKITVERIAKYFGCSTDEFIGKLRKETKRADSVAKGNTMAVIEDVSIKQLLGEMVDALAVLKDIHTLMRKVWL